MARPFVPPGTRARYTPDRPVGVLHIKLDVELDLAERALRGTSTLDLSARRDRVEAVTLDAVEMDIGAVTVDGQAVRDFDHDGEKLRVVLPRACKRGERFTVAVRYACKPRRGLYFVGPSPAEPMRPWHAWTQGQDEDARHVFPCLDAPIEKATTEVVCTAPAGQFVLSNGDLRERLDLPDGRTRWHWALDLPHSTYLVTLVCGPFVELRERAVKTGVDVYAYVLPGFEPHAQRSFARTREMLDLFSERIGVPYPHKRYSQVVVGDFIFGGMENTAATTLTDLALLDERAALDHDVEGLVSHELAHQWWGDLLTCRDWSEAWLNEGFATYFEYVWREHAHGRDEADVELLNDADSYLGESAEYQRPIVHRHYEEPIDLFDRHLYEKGGRVLHMLRHEIGEDAFWRALKLYAERHARGSVETRDLARAVEEASGRNLDAFFDQWVARAGHPDIEAEWSWNDDKHLGTLRISQKPRAGDAPPYVFTARVRFEVEGKTHDEELEVTERSHAFEVHLAHKPTQVVFDPGDVLLKTLKMDKPRPLWRRQLEAAPLGVDRVLAARALAKTPEPEAVKALARALTSDAFWAVRAAAARALGALRRDDALDALLGALTEKHPKVRRAVAWALGEFRDDERAAGALAAALEHGDASWFVEAEMAAALGRTRSPRALPLLTPLVARASFQDVLRARSLEGLAASGDERALPVARAAYRQEHPFQGRRAAVAALGRLAEGTFEAKSSREHIERALDDDDFRVRTQAAYSLRALGDMRAVPSIEKALARELDGRARRAFKDVLRDLREGRRPGEELRRAREEMERLRGETGKLRERLEKLEHRVAGEHHPRPKPRKAAARAARKPAKRARR